MDLFSGKGLIWYRSVRSSIQDWDSLVLLLKQEFLPSDYDDQLWEEIKSRKQGKNETVSIFIAIMETLFKRLSRPPCEITKIKHIRQNLLPQYFSQLALLDIPSVSELSKLCKKLEDAYVSQSKYRQPQKPYVEMLEPELAYVANSHTVSNFSEPSTSKIKESVDNAKPLKTRRSDDVQYKNNSRRIYRNFSRSGDSVSAPVLCWNCGQANHTYSACTVKRKKFCYKCGHPNVTVSTCSKCSGNA